MKTSILKIVESPGEFGLLIKGVKETVEYEVRKELFKPGREPLEQNRLIL